MLDGWRVEQREVARKKDQKLCYFMSRCSLLSTFRPGLLSERDCIVYEKEGVETQDHETHNWLVLVLFPVAAVTKYHIPPIGLQQHKFIIVFSGDRKFKMDNEEPKSTGLDPPGGSREEFVSSSFLASRGCRQSLTRVSFLRLQSASPQPLPSCHISSL